MICQDGAKLRAILDKIINTNNGSQAIKPPSRVFI